MFKSEAKSEFGTTAIISGAMETAIRYWMDIYSGRPDWVDPEDNIKTIKFAKSICSETARLVTLAIGVSFDGNRGDYMENWNNSAVMPHLRKWVEYGCAFGTIVLKPNGNGVDIVTPANFEVTEVDGMGKITGMRFQDRYKSGDNWYTKLEQHSFRTAKVRYEESGEYEDVTFYLIQNRAYISNNEAEIGKPIDLSMTKWSMLQPDVTLTKKNGENIDSMLFGVFAMPNANDLDLDSPYGMSLFSEAVEELKDLDIAYSRFTGEIKDSQDIELLGETMLQEPGRKINAPSDIKLPHHVKRVPGTSEDDFYQAIERPLRSSDRQVGINHLLSEIGYKCGYSNGYFVLDQKTGMVTATQVYNKTSDDLMGSETWYATVLKNVRLIVTKGANVSNSGLDSADSAKLYVRWDFLPEDTKKYLQPKAWQQSAEKESNFTFTGGADFFVEGDTSQENPCEDFFTYMKEKYDNCFKVTNVDDYNLIPHIEVGGA